MAEIPIIAAVPTPHPTSSQNGAVGGGILRPGAIDQSQFQKMLQAQYQAQNQGKTAESSAVALPSASPSSSPSSSRGMTLSDYRKLAGIQVASGATPNPPTQLVPAPKQVQASSPGDGIPTLSLEQFAALTGLSAPESSSVSIPATSGTTAIELATSPVEIADATPMEMAPDDMTAPPAAAAISAEEPAGIPAGIADGVPVAESQDDAAIEPAANSRVVMLESFPDREEQRSLAAQGKTWHMKETPGARELFLGPDGKFGWDDFVDIINPLQHIPVVAQIYRAVTGDQAYGLSAFLGAAPFGPLSIASAVVDTVIRSQTGRDAGTDMAARIFGIDNRTPEEADLHLGQPGQPELAGIGDAPAFQVADASIAQQAASTSAWTRDSAGVARD